MVIEVKGEWQKPKGLLVFRLNVQEDLALSQYQASGSNQNPVFSGLPTSVLYMYFTP